MLKKTITYVDYNDQEVTEDFYFNFTKIEIAEMLELEYEGGLEDTIKKLTETNDSKKAYELFKKLILDAYGRKSDDGKRFIKSPDLREEFEQSPALSELIIEFLQNPTLGAVFIEGTLPKALVAEVKSAQTAKTPGVHKPAESAAIRPYPGMFRAAADQDVTAAQDVRTEGATPVDSNVRLSTSEKRQYTQEDLEAMTGVPGTVPGESSVAPAEVVGEITGEPSDEQVLAMTPKELGEKGLLMRAYQLRMQQG